MYYWEETIKKDPVRFLLLWCERSVAREAPSPCVSCIHPVPSACPQSQPQRGFGLPVTPNGPSQGFLFTLASDEASRGQLAKKGRVPTCEEHSCVPSLTSSCLSFHTILALSRAKKSSGISIVKLWQASKEMHVKKKTKQKRIEQIFFKDGRKHQYVRIASLPNFLALLKK